MSVNDSTASSFVDSSKRNYWENPSSLTDSKLTKKETAVSVILKERWSKKFGNARTKFNPAKKNFALKCSSNCEHYRNWEDDIDIIWLYPWINERNANCRPTLLLHYAGIFISSNLLYKNIRFFNSIFVQDSTIRFYDFSSI